MMFRNTKIIAKKLMLLGATTCALAAGSIQAATVDLLVLYDAYSRNYFGGDPQTAMNNWVNQMNSAYAASQIDVQLRLVGVRELNPGGADMGAVLGNLRVNATAIALR